MRLRRVAQVDVFLEAAAPLQGLLRFGLVLPEVRLGDALLDCASSSAGRAASKIAPQVGGAARQILVPAELLVELNGHRCIA